MKHDVNERLILKPQMRTLEFVDLFCLFLLTSRLSRYFLSFLYYLLATGTGYATDDRLLLHRGRKHALEGPRRLMYLNQRIAVRFASLQIISLIMMNN